MLSRLLTHIKLSCVSLPWYSNLRSRPFSNHLGAWLLIIFFASIASSLRVYTDLYPQLEKNLLEISRTTTTHFPDSLVLTWTDNLLMINQDSLVLPFPNVFSQTSPFDSARSIYIASKEIDQSTTASLLQDHSFVVTPTTIYTYSAGVIQPLLLTEVIPLRDVTVNKEVVNDLDVRLTNTLTRLKPLFFSITPFIIFIILTFSRLIAVIIDSLLIYMLMRIQNAHLSYSSILLLCLNVMIPSEIIHQVVQFTDLPQQSYMFSIVFWIYMLVILTFRKSLTTLIVERMRETKD